MSLGGNEMEPLVDVSGVSKVYGAAGTGRRALDEISLTVATGEFVAVMGPSGSGKSTLLNVVGGLDRSYTGSVRLGGVPLESCDDDALAEIRRRRLGFVFQAFNLVPVLSALENVALPGVLDGRPTRECERRARELLTRFGLGDREAEMPAELSGGEQQRLAIARALFLEPELILADEPTGNLDSGSGGEVLDVLATANASLGQTVVLVTHDPTAAVTASRVVRLRDGAVAGTIDFGADEADGARRRRLIRWLEEPTSRGGRPHPLVAR